MITLRHPTESDVIEIVATGTLTHSDYEAFVPQLERLVGSSDRRHEFLLSLEDFHGWQPRALLDEINFDIRFRRQIGRTAVVGDRNWEKWGVKFAGIFFASDVRYFPEEARAEAWEWLRTPVHAAAAS